MLATSREDAWVHEGGHTEVGQHKKEDDAIVYWYGNRKILRKPWAPETQREKEKGHITHSYAMVMSTQFTHTQEVLAIEGS